MKSPFESASAPASIITGASSGVGLHAAPALAERNGFVVPACRDLAKAELVARPLGIPADRHATLSIDLGSQRSAKGFVDAFRSLQRPLDALVNNAAVFLPRRKEPQRSPEGYEISVATNHLGHFDTALFRHTPPAFQCIFPWLQKNITMGYVTQELAGERVAQGVADEAFAQSGVHWSWGNRQKPGRQPFSQPLSSKADELVRAERLRASGERLVGLA